MACAFAIIRPSGDHTAKRIAAMHLFIGRKSFLTF